MISFEEFVMVSAMTDCEKRELADKFAAKRLSPDNLKIAGSLGQSPLTAWIANQA